MRQRNPQLSAASASGWCHDASRSPETLLLPKDGACSVESPSNSDLPATDVDVGA